MAPQKAQKARPVLLRPPPPQMLTPNVCLELYVLKSPHVNMTSLTSFQQTGKSGKAETASPGDETNPLDGTLPGSPAQVSVNKARVGAGAHHDSQMDHLCATEHLSRKVPWRGAGYCLQN